METSTPGETRPRDAGSRFARWISREETRTRMATTIVAGLIVPPVLLLLDRRLMVLWNPIDISILG
jgi:hypothetical protein